MNGEHNIAALHCCVIGGQTKQWVCTVGVGCTGRQPPSGVVQFCVHTVATVQSCDRILVMAAGRIVAELPAGAGEEEVMAQAVGSLGTHHEDPRAAGTVP